MLKKILVGGFTLLLLFQLAGLALASQTMQTFLKASAGKAPSPDQLTFTAFFKGNEEYVLTEDSLNHGTSSWTDNGGYARLTGDSMGVCSVRTGDIEIPNHVSVTDNYEIWISSNSEAGYASKKPIGSADPIVATQPGSLVPTLDLLTLASGNYLAAPASVNISAGTNNITLNWGTVAGATSYLVYRRPAKNHSSNAMIYEKVDEVTAPQTSKTYTVTPNVKYRYIIVARETSGAAEKRSRHTDEVTGEAGAPATLDVIDRIEITPQNPVVEIVEGRLQF